MSSPAVSRPMCLAFMGTGGWVRPVSCINCIIISSVNVLSRARCNWIEVSAENRIDNVKAVIWFESWRYQNEASPIVALLHEMRSQLEWHVKLVDQTRKTFAVAIRGALLSLEDLTQKIGFQTSKIEQAGREWEQQHLAADLPSNTIRQQLEEAIYGLIAPGVPKEKHKISGSRS